MVVRASRRRNRWLLSTNGVLRRDEAELPARGAPAVGSGA
jgi:hypothetical protein